MLLLALNIIMTAIAYHAALEAVEGNMPRAAAYMTGLAIFNGILALSAVARMF